jgi:hypothetical protein
MAVPHETLLASAAKVVRNYLSQLKDSVSE